MQNFHGKSGIREEEEEEEDCFHQQIGIKFKEGTSKILHFSVAMYDTETWTLRRVDQNELDILEMWCWRRG
jgi:hypothetical protein